MNKLNKKGDFSIGSKWPFWIAFTFIIALLFVGFGCTTAIYKNKLVSVPAELRVELLTLRFTNNPDCFAYVDEVSGRVLSGVVDIRKFTEENLNNCYRTDQKKGIKDFNFRLRLEQGGEEIITNKYFYHDKDELTILKEVLVKKDNHFTKDNLIIFVQEKIGT